MYVCRRLPIMAKHQAPDLSEGAQPRQNRSRRRRVGVEPRIESPRVRDVVLHNGRLSMANRATVLSSREHRRIVSGASMDSLNVKEQPARRHCLWPSPPCTTLNIANGTRGKVVANMYAPNTNTLTVTIVDFPSYTGSSLIGPGWPHSWVPVAPVTRVCDKGCCERTGFPLAPGSHVTLFKCQGLTCGHGKTNERLLLYCEDLVRAEKMWPRSFYVALTRTIDASDLAFVHTTGLKYELWETINRASYHQIRKEENKSNELASKETCAEVAQHTTHTGWVKLLTTIDTLANDGLTDATCASNDRILCASQNCAACKLATESART
mmetsp:Transcript_39022/g.89659  ORF Transcript_39022/g.89659 Transcript_39022/m.89659 type:complete len:324 (-) Transcript_39022:1-972(-)